MGIILGDRKDSVMSRICSITWPRTLLAILVLTVGIPAQQHVPAVLAGNSGAQHQSVCPDNHCDEAKVEISYAPTGAKFSLHEPVVVSFEVTNHLAEPIKIDLGYNGLGAFKFRVIRPDGTVVTNPTSMTEEGLAWPGKHRLEAEQTYTRSLVLNQWFEFSEPGAYQVEARLDAPIRMAADDVAVPHGGSRFTFYIEPRNETRLRQVCASLLEKISQSGNDYKATLEAATPLSYVNDPVAVTYLEQAVEVNPLSYYVVVKGLGRIRTEEAVRVLIKHLSSVENGTDWPRQAVLVLQEVEKTTVDKSLRQKIGRALREYFNGHD
jgi:hypothetical protein